jgi:hypothetical protein
MAAVHFRFQPGGIRMNKKIDPKSSSNKRIVSFFVLTLLFFTLIVAMSGCIDGDGQTAGTEDSIGQTEDTDTDEADEDPAEQTFMSPQDQDLEEQEPLEQEEDTFTVRVSPGSGSRSSSGSGANPATPVTSGGTLELDPSYANNNTDADITVIYRVGENITDGMVSIGIPAQLTVNETLDNLSIANGPWTTVLGNSNASYDANNILTITDLNIKENETIKLTLATQSIDLAGSYDFTAAAKNSGKDISNPVTATLTIYNDDSKLKALTISPGLLDPAFATGTGNYAASVDYDVEQLIIQAILSDTNAGLMVNGIITSSGDITPVILNGPGEYTEIAIDVLAEDNVSFSNYTINVSRAITPHIQDTGVSITEGSVIFGYSFYNETGALLTYADATASPYLLNSTASTVTLINQTGAASNAIPLDSMGIDASGNVTFHNLAEIAAAFNIADIMQWDHPTTVILDLRGGQGQYTWTLQETITLTPADIAAFTSIIPGSITGQVTGTTAVPLENALVQLEGMPQYSANTDAFGIYTIENVPAGSYNVTAGIADHKSSTHEQVVVLAAQPTTGIDFALTSTNPALAALHVNPGSLDPAFDTQTGTYNVAVSHTVDTIQLTAIPANPQANISINSDPYTSGDIKTIALQAPASSTDILIHVTAEDQTGTRTYNVTVNRAAVPEYTVTFNVTDGTDPVADAQILIDSQTLTTDASGIASMDLINGSYEYNITAHGYYAEQGTAVVSGEPLEIPVSMNTVPVIQDASVSITEGSVIFGYTFYNETAALLTYADATTSPYLLNSTASTVILVNGTGASSDAISLGSLDIDASGNAEYNNLSEFAAAFNIADIMHWKHPATVILDLSGGQGQYTWTLQETITLTPADIDAFTSIIPGSITGQVTSTAGIPLENALVQLEGMPQYSANTDAFGIYTIENVPAGSYNVTAGIAGHRTDTDQNVVVLAAQPTTGIDFELVPIYTVTFTVNDGKLPIGNAQIKIGGQILSTSGAGIAAIDLADGIYNYNITASGYYPVEEDVTVSGAPVDITVSMDTVPAIKNTDVSITEGSVIFGYAFYNQTGALLSYADATADPYLLNSTASTVTLLNQSGAPTAAISLDSLGPDASGNTTYENLTEFADAFSIADVTQWSHPASVTLDLSGGQGQYTWTLQKTITLTPADIAAFMSMVSTSPEGDLLDAAAGSDFIGVLYYRDNMIYYKQGSTGNWNEEFWIGNGTQGRIAIDSSDNVHTAYTTPEGKIGYRAFDGNAWSTEELIESNNFGGAGSCSKADIAVDGSGKAHITYTDSHGSTGDDYKHPDIMYATNISGSFTKTLIYKGYRDYSSSGSWGANYFNKGSFITVNDDGDYFIVAHKQDIWRWFNGNDVNYYVLLKSSTDEEQLGYNYGSDIFNVYDLITRNGKLYALYRNGAQIKASEITIDAAGQMTSSVDKVVFDAGSAYSLDVASSDIVIGSKDGNNLRAHYNNIPQTFTEIDVKGEAVSIVHLGGSFYAAYTDNEDGLIKVQEVQ